MIKESQKGATDFIMVAVMAIAIIVLGVVGYSFYAGRSAKQVAYQTTSSIPSALQETQVNSSAARALNTTKCIGIAKQGTNGCWLVPIDWSIYHVPETGTTSEADLLNLGKPFMAVAKDVVSFGDLNGTQVEFFASTVQFDKWKAKLGDEVKKDPTNSIHSATIGGKVAIYLQLSTEKEGTGGRYYIIPVEDTSYIADNFLNSIDGTKTLIIFKQAQGSPEFEQGFDVLLKSINFQK